MHNTAVLSTFHHLPNDCGTLDPLPDVRCESKNGESDSEADILRGRMDYLSNTHRPSQDSHLPDTLAESVDRETVPALILGMINPPSQEVLGGTGVVDVTFGTYPPYSGSYFDQDSPPTAHDFVPQTMGRPALSYPVRQMANTLADIGLFGFPAEMERQSTPEMTYKDRSSGAASALDRDGLATWPGSGHTPSTSNHCDHISFGLLFNPLEDPSSRRSIESIREAALNLCPADGDLTVIPKLGAATTFSPPPQDTPINWLKIPQERYTQRGGARPFSQSGEITFSVNNTRGINMQNALRRHFTGLDGRDDFVLENAKGPVSCRLLFPGYPINRSSQIAVRNWKKDSSPITRSKLAHEIAKRVKQYLDTLATIPIDPSVDPRWTIGQSCMKLDKMYLVSFAWVSKGSHQPEIWVDNSV